MTYENQLGRLSMNEMEFMALNIYIYVALFAPTMAMEFNWTRVYHFFPRAGWWLIFIFLEALVFGFCMNQSLSISCITCACVLTFIILLEALVLFVGMIIFGPKTTYMVKFEEDEL